MTPHEQTECQLKTGEIEGLKEEFRILLSFYGSELQSHGALIAGFALITFAAVQASKGLESRPPYVVTLFSLLVGGLALLLVHSAVRLVAYGKLATAITGADSTQFQEAKCRYMTSHNPKQWEALLPLAKASTFAGDYFYYYTKGILVVAGIYTRTSRVRRPILFILFGWSSFLSYFLISGLPEPWLCALILLLSLGTAVGVGMVLISAKTERKSDIIHLDATK